jgi:hypothetical protein
MPEQDKAPTVPARAKQVADTGRIAATRAQGGSFGLMERMVSALVSGVKEGCWAFFLADVWLFAITQPTSCETLPMRKLPTGEPYAGKPLVRFGGRGRRQPLPTPINDMATRT